MRSEKEMDDKSRVEITEETNFNQRNEDNYSIQDCIEEQLLEKKYCKGRFTRNEANNGFCKIIKESFF